MDVVRSAHSRRDVDTTLETNLMRATRCQGDTADEKSLDDKQARCMVHAQGEGYVEEHRESRKQ